MAVAAALSAPRMRQAGSDRLAQALLAVVALVLLVFWPRRC